MVNSSPGWNDSRRMVTSCTSMPETVSEAVARLAGLIRRREPRRGFLDLRIGELEGADDRGHPGTRIASDLGDVTPGRDRRHQGLIETQVDLVELALPDRELAVGGKHAADVRGVVLVVGRVVELNDVTILQLAQAAVVVACRRCSTPWPTVGSTLAPASCSGGTTHSEAAVSSYSSSPGAASRIASMMPAPVIRVTSRIIAISRALLMKRMASMIGSRSLICDPWARARLGAANSLAREDVREVRRPGLACAVD